MGALSRIAPQDFLSQCGKPEADGGLQSGELVMTIWAGFEGYKDPTEDDALALLRDSLVIVDTNVLLDLYSIPESARNLALDALQFLQNRLFVPHQVMREFWRNRQATIAEAPVHTQPLDGVRDELFAILNSLRPDRGRSDELEAIRSQIDSTLEDLRAQIDDARGAPLDIKRILEDNSLDPVLKRLETILDGRTGPGFDNEAAMVEKGLKRFAEKIPPGYMDGEEKKDQRPEKGTGDYLLWEQALEFVGQQPEPRSFVLVTNDSKEDWRSIIKKPHKRVLGVRPELVSEALERVGAHFVLMDPRDFYRLMDTIRQVDAEASRSLTSALQTVSESRTREVGEWTLPAYRQLLSNLRRDGYDAQADVIERAATSGGMALRKDVYEIAGYADDRSLRRFSMPARGATLALRESGVIAGEVASPLEAAYDGPGKTIGYEVPEEFVRFAAASPQVEVPSYTWLEAAAQVARAEPDRVWSVQDLVEKISDTGLRDLSGAATPAATLARDLRLRGHDDIEQVGSGYRARA